MDRGTVIRLETPLDRDEVAGLRAGDMIELSGDILVFRDQVHRILCEMLAKGEPPPFELAGAALYYCGPTPPKHGMPVGSAGPTTSSRMDPFTEPLLEAGLAVTIGKGDRSQETAALFRRYGAAYLAAVGGTGAFLAQRVTASTVIGFDGLGPEAARMFTVKSFPCIVAIDSRGNSAFA